MPAWKTSKQAEPPVSIWVRRDLLETNGTFYGATGNGWIKPRIQWSAEANTEGNYSDVTATLSYTRTNHGYTTYGYWAGSLTINADCKSASGVYTEITEAGYRDIITHTVIIPMIHTIFPIVFLSVPDETRFIRFLVPSYAASNSITVDTSYN